MNIGYNKGKKYNVLKDTTQQLIIKGILAEAIEVRSTSKNNKLPYGWISVNSCEKVLGSIPLALCRHNQKCPKIKEEFNWLPTTTPSL
jgi:hypothetical protein